MTEFVAKKFSSSEPIKISDSDLGFAKEVGKVAETDLGSCLTCMSCSGGCPMYQYMDYGPHGIMRLSVLGLKKEALTSNTIWRCLGCHSCAAVCPMAINIAGVMDYLRQECLREKLPAGDKAIVDFHKCLLNSARRNGRVHKVELMAEFKLRSMAQGPKAWFQDAGVGLKMILAGRLHLLPNRISSDGRQKLKKFFNGPWRGNF